MRLLTIAVVVAVLLGGACGGSIGESRDPGGAGGGAGADSTGGTGGGGAVSSSLGGTVAGGVTSTYVDPGCPDTVLPTVYSECDPLGDGEECASGYGCVPITTYPDEPCESEIYQMLCLPVGDGEQWAPCSSLSDCAAGYLCVVSGLGTECEKMCDPEGTSTCPTGLFCDGVDLQGIGICS